MKIKIILPLFIFLLPIKAPAQNEIVPSGSTLKKLSSDQFGFVEGPVWYEDSVLLFTDLRTEPAKIYKYSPSGRKFSIFRGNSNRTNGLTCNAEGVLLGCEQNTARVVSMDRNGNIIRVLADSYNNTRFNSPNDLIADANGGVYFTDPAFGRTTIHMPQSVYYISREGEVTRVLDQLEKPNGIILSPDGKSLYVVDTNNKYLFSCKVKGPGDISAPSKTGILKTKDDSAYSRADGLAADIKGNIYVTTELGVQIFSPAGQLLDIIEVPEKPTNCDFGGKDMKTLYITAQKNLYSIELNVPGFVLYR